MQIQINSDNHIALHAKLSNFVETELHRVLHRFDRQLTRVEVHLSDEIGSRSSSKSGSPDKCCKLEARPRGLQPLVVTGVASNTQQSISDAAEKMKRQLDATFGRLAARRFNSAQPNYEWLS